MKHRKRVGMFFAIFVGLLASGFSFALAQPNFPTRPIEVVIPLSPGGGADVVFTPFKDKVAKILGQPVVVSYKAGSSGAIGTAFVAKAKPDGYTLLFGNKGGVISAPLTMKGVGYTLDDLAPICLLTRSPAFFYVKYDSPYKTLKDFIQAAKTKRLTYCTHGAFSPNHICMEYLKKVEGLQVTHIPHAGSAPCAVAGLGGHVDMVLAAVPTTMLGPGKLRVIGSTTDERFELFPDAPTLLELGYSVFKGGFVSSAYWLWAPKGTPKDIINKIYEAFKRVVEEDREEIVKMLANSEAILSFLGPEELGKAARNERDVTKKVLDDLGFVPK